MQSAVQVLYSMPPTNFTTRCTPSPLPALAQGLVVPGNSVPAGAATPTQAWPRLLTLSLSPCYMASW